MATSPVQLHNTPSLSLDLSLGTLSSPCTLASSNNGEDHPPRSHHDLLKRRKHLESEDIRQQYKKARKEDHNDDEDHAASSTLCNSSVTSSGNFHGAYSLLNGYHGHSSLELDRKMTGCDGDSCHSCTSFVHAQSTPSCTSSSLALNTTPLPSSSCAHPFETGSNRIINNMLPIARKLSRGDEEGKSSSTSSGELEDGDNVDEQSTAPQKNLVAEIEAPRSRCGSNSDMIRSMGTSALMPSTIPMMHMHRFPMVPMQVPCSMPTQWGYAFPYALSAPSPSAKRAKGQTPSRMKEMSPAGRGQEAIPRSASDECTSALSSSWPPLSALPTSNCKSDVCTSSVWPSPSSTSPEEDHLSEVALQQPWPANEVCRSLLQSQCNISTRQKPTKTVRFSSCDGELAKKPTKTVRFSSDATEPVKSLNDEGHQRASSSLLSKSCCKIFCKNGGIVKSCESQLAKKTLTLEADAPLRSYMQRSDQGCQEGGNANTVDHRESAAIKDGACKQLDSKNAAKLPVVSITCAGPNGKTIYGELYIIKGKQTRLICSCHGMQMTPSEFVQHSGSTDLSNPERSIVVTGFSCMKPVL